MFLTNCTVKTTAQVHRACLVTGQQVAVKVQYPALAGAVAADLAAIKLLSWLTSKFFPKYNMDWLAYGECMCVCTCMVSLCACMHGGYVCVCVCMVSMCVYMCI